MPLINRLLLVLAPVLFAGGVTAGNKPLQVSLTPDMGVQIGLVNLIPPNEWFTGLPNELAPGMIVVNWRF